MSRRNRNPDQDLALALAHVRAAFGEVEVLEARPNPRPNAQQRAKGNRALDEAGQGVLDLDGPGEGGEAVA